MSVSSPNNGNRIWEYYVWEIKPSLSLGSATVRLCRRLAQRSPEGRHCHADMVTKNTPRCVHCHVLPTAQLVTVHCTCSKYGSGRLLKTVLETAQKGADTLWSPCRIRMLCSNGTGTASSWENWSPSNYHSANNKSIINTYLLSEVGTTGHSTKGLSLNALLQLVQFAAVPRDSVSTHWYSWYSWLQYQETRYQLTGTAGTTGHSTKGLSLNALLQLVQLAAAPRDSVSTHWYSWYSWLQYQGTQYQLTGTARTVVCSTKGLSLPHWYNWYSTLQYQETQSCYNVNSVTAATAGCSTKGFSLPHWYSWYGRLQYQGVQRFV